VHQRLQLLFEECYNLSRVLTFDHAGFGQRSLSSRRFGLRLRGGSGLLGGRRGFFFRHSVEGSSPSQDRSVDFLQKYTNWLSIKIDYYIMY
jgi:hypothetical protein